MLRPAKSTSDTLCSEQLFSWEPSVAWNIGEWQHAAADMHVAKFGATMQRREHFAGIEQAAIIEGAFHSLLMIEIDRGEHRRHEVALLNADAMLAGEHAADR